MENEISKKRKEKIINWIKNPYNLSFLLIILFAIGIRLYYFFLTQNQPLWWDEAEYMLKAKSLVFGTPQTGWANQREIVVPIIWGIFYLILKSEFLPRLSQIIVSVLIVFLTYYFGKELYNKKTGLIASFIIAVNAVYLFFSVRLLVYLWAPMFFLLFFYFFWKGYVKKEKIKFFYISAIIAAIGIAVYGSLAFGILAVLLFLIITEQYKFLIKKEIWIVGFIGLIFLIPQFIYNYVSYGNIFSRWAGFRKKIQPEMNFSHLFSYFKMFPHLFGIIFTILVVIGAIYFLFMLLISLDIITKNKNKNLKANLFIILVIFTVFGFYTYAAVSGEAVYDAFIMPALPFLAIMAAQGILFIAKIPKKNEVMNFILILILLIGAFYQINYANNMIKSKIISFEEVKNAGIWLKKNSYKDAIIISKSVPQITYYSERKTYDPAISSEKMLKQFKELSPSYFIDSIFEPTEMYVHQFPEEHKKALTPVNVYFLDIQKTNPSLIIYAVDSSKL